MQRRRRVASWLFPFVLVFGFADLWLLMKVGQRIGAGYVLFFVITSALLGIQLLRRDGAKAMHELNVAFAQGRVPSRQAVEVLLVFLSAILFVVPGFMSSAAGFAILMPGIRERLAQKMVGVVQPPRHYQGSRNENKNTVHVELEVENTTKNPKPLSDSKNGNEHER